MVIASELRAGMAIRIEGEIYKVLEAESKAGAAKLGGVVKTKLRNVTTGRAWGPHFRPQERLEDPTAHRDLLYSERFYANKTLTCPTRTAIALPCMALRALGNQIGVTMCLSGLGDSSRKECGI